MNKPWDDQESGDSVPGAPDLPSQLKDDSAQEVVSKKDRGAETVNPSEQKDEQAKSDADEVIESEQTEEAVDDIVRKEGDELLETHDRASAKDAPLPKKKSGKRKWVVRFVFLILLAAAALIAVPSTRYTILNFAGVRVSSSVVVVDQATGQPLKNVKVTLGDTSAETGGEGTATLEQLKLGPQTLTIERMAFAKISKEVTLGWGSNPLGEFELTPAGAQYTFVIRDFLSNQPIEDAEVISGKAVAASDDDGKAVLTIEQTEQSELLVTVSAKGYRTDDVSLAVDTTDDVSVALVPNRKAVFVASSEGLFNVYGMYIDGKGRKVLLKGTGKESSDMSLAVSTDGARAALVSTRENIKAEDGSLLESLTLINVNDAGNKILDRGEQVQLIDWIGSTLIYQMTVPGAGANNDKRQRLISYDYKSDVRAELASANEFKSVASAQGAVYYSAGDGQFTMINPDGTGKKSVVNADIANAYRTGYDSLSLRTPPGGGWFDFSLQTNKAAQISSPGSVENRVYITDQSGQKSLWVDGSTLKSYSLSDGRDTGLQTQSGISYPVRWLASTVVLYRAGGADYAISTLGGDAQKVANIIDTSGVVQTY